jgi:hypothetical protein
VPGIWDGHNNGLRQHRHEDGAQRYWPFDLIEVANDNSDWTCELAKMRVDIGDHAMIRPLPLGIGHPRERIGNDLFTLTVIERATGQHGKRLLDTFARTMRCQHRKTLLGGTGMACGGAGATSTSAAS